MKLFLTTAFVITAGALCAQENPLNNPVQSETQLKVNELVQKKAEYHRLTNGVQDGYRIKLHFGVDRENAEAVRKKFSEKFTDMVADLEYQQPNFVVLVGNYRTKLQAFESKQKIQIEFPDAFIVKSKIKVK